CRWTAAFAGGDCSGNQYPARVRESGYRSRPGSFAIGFQSQADGDTAEKRRRGSAAQVNIQARKQDRVLLVAWLLRLGLLAVLSFSGAGAWAQDDEAGTVNQGAATQPATSGGLPAIPGLPALTVTTQPDGTEEYTVTLQILAIM